MSYKFSDRLLAFLPLLPGIYLCFQLNYQHFQYVYNNSKLTVTEKVIFLESDIIVFISIIIAIISYCLTIYLIPIVANYTKSRGLSGKDMGKRGSKEENELIPESLGLVCGITFLMCTISSQLLFAKNSEQLVTYNSALFSICFMIFLGFIDDTLDLKWRYKLILPTIASLPLLSAYSGSTALYVPEPLSYIFMYDHKLTTLGSIINTIVVVDTEANGNIIELGYLFLAFMGFLSVFCTNAINILAGINGLECGQSYIIAATIFTFKMYELSIGMVGDNQMFVLILVIPFIGTSLGLLRYNWYPAQVFVGDTFCYFAGMTFAVLGIHGHFSKTLILLFIPQIINFLYSIPQLFKLLPCPRHRLPRIDSNTRLMYYSAFPCQSNEYKLFKVSSNAEECPNLTLICVILRICGPLHERQLCIYLLILQVVCSVITFYIRYIFLSSVPIQ